MRYREHCPSPPLRPWVECYWTMQGRVSAARVHSVFPDGCMDLLFVMGSSPTLPRGSGDAAALVVGTQRVPLEVRQEGGVDLVGVRFRPGALPAFLPLSAHELVDRGASVDALGQPGWEEVLERMAALPLQERLALLDARLLARLRRQVPDRFLARAVALLGQGDGPSTAGAVADHLGMARRTLERRFRDGVGVGPGTLGRILRFRRAVELIRAPGGPPLARVAACCGYADQPHLTREVRDMAGRTPGQLRAEVDGDAPA